MFRPKIAAMAAALTMTGVIPAFAQLNTVEKHPTMTGIAAGVATHAALKRAAANQGASQEAELGRAPSDAHIPRRGDGYPPLSQESRRAQRARGRPVTPPSMRPL
jgi:hypothetical protein